MRAIRQSIGEGLILRYSIMGNKMVSENIPEKLFHYGKRIYLFGSYLIFAVFIISLFIGVFHLFFGRISIATGLLFFSLLCGLPGVPFFVLKERFSSSAGRFYAKSMCFVMGIDSSDIVNYGQEQKGSHPQNTDFSNE